MLFFVSERLIIKRAWVFGGVLKERERDWSLQSFVTKETV
jgi:hypothetical protein